MGHNPVGNATTENEGKGASNTSKGSCRFWMSEKGCLKGMDCKYSHAALEPQSNRCFNCSAMRHTKRDCPVKHGAETNKDSRNKVAKTSKSKGKGGKSKEDEPAEKPIEDDPKDQKGDLGKGGNEDRVTGLIDEATALLKTINPKVKTINVKDCWTGVPRMPLGGVRPKNWN